MNEVLYSLKEEGFVLVSKDALQQLLTDVSLKNRVDNLYNDARNLYQKISDNKEVCEKEYDADYHDIIKNYETNDIDIYVPESFINNIDDYNNKFVKNQIKNINEVLEIVNKNNHIRNRPNEKQKSVATDWCRKYNLEINQNFIF